MMRFMLLSVILLRVILLSVILLSIVRLNVVQSSQQVLNRFYDKFLPKISISKTRKARVFVFGKNIWPNHTFVGETRHVALQSSTLG